MCKLIIGIKKAGNNAVVSSLIDVQADELLNEKDGMAALSFNGENVRVERDLLDYENVFDNAIKQINNSLLVSIHTRTGTSGAIDQSNVHFFNHNDWYMAHNGFTSSKNKGEGKRQGEGEKGRLLDVLIKCKDCRSTYQEEYVCKKHKGVIKRLNKLLEADEDTRHLGFQSWRGSDWWRKGDGKSDSLIFLEGLPSEVTEKTLGVYAEKENFSGVALLFNEKTHEGYVVIKHKKVYLALPKDNSGEFAVIFSYKPELKVEARSEREINGLPYYQAEKYDLADYVSLHDMPDGVFRLNVEAWQDNKEAENKGRQKIKTA